MPKISGSRVKKELRKTIEKHGREWTDRQPAWLGNLSGTVLSDKPGVFYARLANGKVVEVHNTFGAPPTFDLHVTIGRTRNLSRIWQIIEVMEDYDTPATGGQIAYHHEQHEFPNGDTVWVNRKQITQLSVIVSDGANFIATLFGGVILTIDGPVEIASQSVDLSSEIGGADAKFVNIECDNDGVVSLNSGSDFGSKFAGSADNVPTPEPGKHLIAYALLYDGQTELVDEDIVVPMPIGFNPGGYMTTSVYDTDNDGIVDEAEHALTADLAGNPNRFLAMYNYYFGGGTPGYKLGLARSADGRTWEFDPEPVIDLGTSGQWDDETLQFPCLLQVDGVLYCYYSGKDGGGGNNFKIGLAQSFDGGATWSRHASNPLIDNNIAWENTNVFGPVILYDREETDSNKRWKMWYAGSSFGQGIGYAYSANGISWTKAAGNPILELGTSGQWDDAYIMPRAIIRRGAEYILFYSGNNGSSTWSAGYATFTDPEGTYTKSANNPILTGDGITTTLTADLTSGSTTATVSDATVFPIGCPVWIGGATRFLTHVIARNSSTSLELADEAPTTIASGQIVRSVAYNSIDITGVRYDDGYKFTITPHQPDGGSETGVHELTMLAYANDDLEQAYIDYGAGVQIPVSVTESQNTSVSRENWSLLDTQETEQRHKPAGQSVTFNDGEGDPEDVTSGSAADGTSQYAARRDHAHHGASGQYRALVWEDDGAGGWTFVTIDGAPVLLLTDLE